ncbi:MAG: hypothetical protein PGN07_07710 [Aeromicrobium erythreum]
MNRSAIALAGVALAAGVLVAAPAEAATYGVTLNLSKSTADVGQKIGLSGKVSGSKAAKKKLSVQYRLGSGSWKTVKTVTTSSKATYATTFTVKTAGAAGLRVVAPKSGSTKAGTSPAKPFTGYRWLSLYDESYLSDGFIARGWDSSISGTVNGGHPPRETFAMANDDAPSGDHTFLAWRLSNQCDLFRAEAGLSDSDDTTRYLRLNGTVTERKEVVSGEITHFEQSLVGAYSVGLSREAGDASGYVAVERPRAHCSLNTLPIAYD